MQKRVMAINDISCYGRCALTVTLPILSAAGFETSIIPTVVLSTHLGYPQPSYFSMTDQIAPITKHLQSLPIGFDAITSGFLDSREQVALVASFFKAFKTQDTFIMIDPTMADHGKMYGNKNFDHEFLQDMKDLCTMANLVVPNITEACFITGQPFINDSYDEVYIENLLKGLLTLGPKEAVITGVTFDKQTIGSACMKQGSHKFFYTFAPLLSGKYIGTGDLYASVILAARLHNFTLEKSAEIATSFVSKAIERSNVENTQSSRAINFEQCTGLLLDMLGLKNI